MVKIVIAKSLHKWRILPMLLNPSPHKKPFLFVFYQHSQFLFCSTNLQNGGLNSTMFVLLALLKKAPLHVCGGATWVLHICNMSCMKTGKEGMNEGLTRETIERWSWEKTSWGITFSPPYLGWKQEWEALRTRPRSWETKSPALNGRIMLMTRSVLQHRCMFSPLAEANYPVWLFQQKTVIQCPFGTGQINTPYRLCLHIRLTVE